MQAKEGVVASHGSPPLLQRFFGSLAPAEPDARRTRLRDVAVAVVAVMADVLVITWWVSRSSSSDGTFYINRGPLGGSEGGAGSGLQTASSGPDIQPGPADDPGGSPRGTYHTYSPSPWPPIIALVILIVLVVTLARRRQHPVQALVAQCLFGLVGVLVPGLVPCVGMGVALYTVAARADTRAARVSLAACLVPAIAGIARAASQGGSWVSGSDGVAGGVLFILAVMGGLVGLVIGGSWVLGRARNRADRSARVAELLLAEKAEQALREQRIDLARDLHDIVSHGVSAMLLHAAGGQKLVPDGHEQLRHTLELIETSGVQAMKEMHRMLGLLRNTQGDNGADRPPTLEDVSSLVTLSRSSGLDVTLHTEGEPARIDPSVEVSAYRVVQESLTNVAKHAGEGSRTHITLQWGAGRLIVSVRNDGGLRPRTRRRIAPSAGLGIRGLSERVTLIGGQLQAGPTGAGFLVRAELPTTTADTTPVTFSKDFT